MRRSIIILTIFSCVFLSVNGQIVWNTSRDIASSASDNNHPRIAVDASGNPIVLWFHASRAMFTRWNGSTFEPPRILNPVTMTVAGAGWMGPDIAVQGDTIYVVFKQTPEDVGHVWCIHSFDGGVTFSDPVQVDFIGDDRSRFPTVTTDTSGNPIVAFMKFDDMFGSARWVVTRSDDFGNSFTTDVLASGWSSPSSHVCDCCPGSVVSAENTVAMVYRDNKSNIRDTWAGFSSDGGVSFYTGINVDQQNWMINACPASGPDGVILGDSLYTTFMSASSGKSLVYFNHTAIADLDPVSGIELTGNFSELGLQNYPRISGFDNALGVIWKQVVNGRDQCALKFTNDIALGFPVEYDTVDMDNIVNADIEVWNGNVYTVWEDNGSGTIKFRSGTYETITGVEESIKEDALVVYPNPSNNSWTIEGKGLKAGVLIEIYNIVGHKVYSNGITDYVTGKSLKVDNTGWGSGVYLLKVINGKSQSSKKLIRL